MTIELLDIEGFTFPLKIYYENRRNSTVSVRPTGINIRIPGYLPKNEKERILHDMKKWAMKKIRDRKDKFRPKPQKEYSDGQTIKIGTDIFKIHIIYKDKKSSSGRIDGSTVFLSISSRLNPFEEKRHISMLLGRVIGKNRLPGLEAKIQKINEKYFHKKINKILFKNNRSNWGSCSANGNINISTRLLLAPTDVLEYVCVHELAHLVEMNHSKNFWSLVERVMPDYREKEKWLKNHGEDCYF